ncbi:hypothetical protein ACQKMW_01575 [Pseudomonas sivasensis]|uniref:hypothetical protein n=1 Tax=Pseudomonas sivasensis TaxID=1880678 RepID=UPI003D029452
MRLVSVQYSEFEGMPREWTIDEVTIGKSNLIVGRNSAGKSRTLNLIGSLARTLSGVTNYLPSSCSYKCRFESGDKVYDYEYVVKNAEVFSERLTIDGTIYLERGAGGYGKIFFEGLGDYVEFQTPEREFAIVKRRDAKQHSFIEPIYQWVAAVRHYFFGSSFGKDQLAVFKGTDAGFDEKDSNQLVAFFRKGKKEFPGRFQKKIVQDMCELGYNIQSVDLGFPPSVPRDNVPAELQALIVKEEGVNGALDQLCLSQGMYRVLALLIHLNLLELRGTSTCLIVDDIGEGIDYERSCKLIDILRGKAERSNIQLLMSTNDKFVMNSVPLQEWIVLSRKGSHVVVHNYENSKEKFDDFKFTGLSNFSFFEMDYLNESRTE